MTKARGWLILAGIALFSCVGAAGQDEHGDCPVQAGTPVVKACPECRAKQGFWCSECAAKSPCKLCGGSGWLLADGSGPAPADVAGAAADLARVNSILGTSLRRVETPRFRILTDVPHRQSHRYALLIEKYAGRFNDTFGIGQGEQMWRETCEVYLFDSRESFEKFAKNVDGKPDVAASGGYSSPSADRPRVVLFTDSRDEDEISRVIIHELTHVYLALFYAEGQLPCWVHEGVAQDFEFSYKTSGSRRKASLKIVRKALDDNTLMSLAELSQMKFTPSDLLPYAASWSAVNCLMAKDRAAFVQWVKLMKQGQDQQAAFSSAFASTLDAANAAWRAYIPRQK
ncbi:MAG TPA: DUF1570 domain-containing protein [Planctomycetota bacterium]|nr:DUF1570 domain-containing protein [Planctomycetota bacterium]